MQYVKLPLRWFQGSPPSLQRQLIRASLGRFSEGDSIINFTEILELEGQLKGEGALPRDEVWDEEVMAQALAYLTGEAEEDLEEESSRRTQGCMKGVHWEE